MNQTDAWNANIEKAKLALKTQHRTQMAVAALALDSCEVKRGGRAGYYTLKRFAEEIGMDGRLLSMWVSIYRRVFLKLPHQIQQQASYSQMVEIYPKISENDSSASIARRYNNEFVVLKQERKIIKYGTYLKIISKHLIDRGATATLSKETLEEIQFFVNQIREILDAAQIKPQDHGLFKTELSAANALRKMVQTGEARTVTAQRKLASAKDILEMLSSGPKRLVEIQRTLNLTDQKNKLRTLRLLRRLQKDQLISHKGKLYSLNEVA